MALSASHEERLRKEADFHDQWATEIDPATTLVDETFTAVTAIENQHILSQFGSVKGKRVLDYGCGAGEGAVFFAKQGASVVGIDVSPGMLAAAERIAKHHGVEVETRRVTGGEIPADADEFDLIYGNGVLHHVDLSRSKPELARILKRDGRACFIEPLEYNPVIDVYRRIAKTVRTDDEHPLSFGDIERFSSHFDRVSHREFWLSTLAIFLKFYAIDRADPRVERYWKKVYTDEREIAPLFGKLHALDRVLLPRVPLLRYLCWNTVISVSLPKKPTKG